MANKKNKKNRSNTQQKKATNQICYANDAAEIAYKNNQERISGAILLGTELNPKNNLKFPCVICNKSVQKNQNAIACDHCDKWCHRKCDAMSPEMYEYYVNNQDDPGVTWFCLYCTMKFNHHNIPFTLSDDHEINMLNNRGCSELACSGHNAIKAVFYFTFPTTVRCLKIRLG